MPVDAAELALADLVRTPGSPERAAVEAIVGPLPERLSEAQTISSLLAVARATVRDEVIASGYAAYAATLDDDDRAFAAATRARRADREHHRTKKGRD
ncbi:hypothetical protein BKD30_12165 [Tersicoccus phoenicis]|uniref:Molecular chaperone GrpE n=1 Tax=Tersicoccus phoenicis TaxID=554083 RepID=A0A1R1L847_9MICC|nr:hypothetical protein BKD30_12165 [Tersicoccus phoenicis]